jgi:hypothetical protein
MSSSAAVVLTAVLDKTLKPLLEKVPEGLSDLVSFLDEEASGRLLRWGLRAVRQGLDILLGLVDLPVVERVRNRIDEVLEQLGQGRDAAVVAGWAIGAVDVRPAVAVAEMARPEHGRHERLLGDLSMLAERFSRLCALLRRIAVAVTGLATALAVAGVTAAHALAVTTLGLVLVLGALVVLGRDHTGSLDLPGRSRGVRLLLLSPSDVTA